MWIGQQHVAQKGRVVQTLWGGGELWRRLPGTWCCWRGLGLGRCSRHSNAAEVDPGQAWNRAKERKGRVNALKVQTVCSAHTQRRPFSQPPVRDGGMPQEQAQKTAGLSRRQALLRPILSRHPAAATHRAVIYWQSPCLATRLPPTARTATSQSLPCPSRTAANARGEADWHPGSAEPDPSTSFRKSLVEASGPSLARVGDRPKPSGATGRPRDRTGQHKRSPGNGASTLSTCCRITTSPSFRP